MSGPLDTSYDDVHDTRSHIAGRIAHRIAMHVSAKPFRMANQRPLISLTFDDVPQSAFTAGKPLLDEHGVKATFYISGGLMGAPSEHWDHATREQVLVLHRERHEIGCHTHAHLRVDETHARTFVADIKHNKEELEGLDPDLRIENFAYPFGYGSLASKLRLRRHFASSRSIVPEMNQGDIDLQFLRAFPLIDTRITPGGVDKVLDRALATNGWAIFYSHDVAPRPSPYGCSPALLAYTLAAAKARGIECLPIRDALRRIGATRHV